MSLDFRNTGGNFRSNRHVKSGFLSSNATKKKEITQDKAKKIFVKKLYKNKEIGFDQ